LGKKIVEYSQYKMQEEGHYGRDALEVFQYSRRERPIKGQKYFVHELKTSMTFNNSFLDLKFLYDLESTYSKINVELVEETQKIAQVTIENSEDNSVILA
jgi:hypothetical protein